jgi:hypothetical protein
VHSSRRGFLKATIVAPAVARSFGPLLGRTELAYDSTFDPWVEVYPANLRRNASEVSGRVGGRPILAVIRTMAMDLEL